MISSNLLWENCRILIVPLPIISLWPCWFKYIPRALGFFPPICPCRKCQCKIWLQCEMLDNFLFKCFQCLFLMPASHHKAVKKAFLIYVLYIQSFLFFFFHLQVSINSHGGRQILLKILCVCVSVLQYNLLLLFFFFFFLTWIHEAWYLGFMCNSLSSAVTGGGSAVSSTTCPPRSPVNTPCIVLRSGLSVCFPYLCPFHLSPVLSLKGRVWIVTLGPDKGTAPPTQGLCPNHHLLTASLVTNTLSWPRL